MNKNIKLLILNIIICVNAIAIDPNLVNPIPTDNETIEEKFIFGEISLNKLPISKEYLSLSHGGILSEIEAYSDGVGFILIGENTDNINTALNVLVYKYGFESINSSFSLADYVLNNNEASNLDKDLAQQLKDNYNQSSYLVNGDPCDDNNPDTYNDIIINGICIGENFADMPLEMPVITNLCPIGTNYIGYEFCETNLPEKTYVIDKSFYVTACLPGSYAPCDLEYVVGYNYNLERPDVFNTLYVSTYQSKFASAPYQPVDIRGYRNAITDSGYLVEVSDYYFYPNSEEYYFLDSYIIYSKYSKTGYYQILRLGGGGRLPENINFGPSPIVSGLINGKFQYSDNAYNPSDLFSYPYTGNAIKETIKLIIHPIKNTNEFSVTGRSDVPYDTYISYEPNSTIKFIENNNFKYGYINAYDGCEKPIFYEKVTENVNGVIKTYCKKRITPLQ